ncbi:ribosome maturation factor RimM [Virgibacillus soli]|uniref:ribosome maturation factor RimM n=1 Tax=Paracerasibacillus soli TaxID=480284 RepID=UPI0035EA6CB3
MNKMFNVGKIINTHGIRGEVKVKRITDFAERFSVGNTLHVDMNGQIKQVEIDGYRVHKGFDLLHFAGYDNINDVEKWKGAILKISDDQLTDLEEDEYYFHEIIGCEVYTNDDVYLGVITEILTPGANDVWVVRRVNEGKDVLIPYIEQVVKTVDISNKKVTIELMEGLLD